jgi:hypothetical protein
MKRRTLPIALTALGLAVPAIVPASSAAVASPASGPYSGMGTCPTGSPQLQSPDNALVGCVVSTVGGGSFTIGGTTVTLTQPMTVKFGVYWPNNGPTLTFPDGRVSPVFTTVAPTDGVELSAPPVTVPIIPGIPDILPGLTSVTVQIVAAGPITGFAPTSAGENHPLFKLPIKLHLQGSLLGPSCFIGSDRTPIVLAPTAGTTSPPPPNQPVTGNAGNVTFTHDPKSVNVWNLDGTGARLVDNSFAVPGATGCGLFDTADWLVDKILGVPSTAGHNAVTQNSVASSVALDTGISDLINTIGAARG